MAKSAIVRNVAGKNRSRQPESLRKRLRVARMVSRWYWAGCPLLTTQLLQLWVISHYALVVGSELERSLGGVWQATVALWVGLCLEVLGGVFAVRAARAFLAAAASDGFLRIAGLGPGGSAVRERVFLLLGSALLFVSFWFGLPDLFSTLSSVAQGGLPPPQHVVTAHFAAELGLGGTFFHMARWYERARAELRRS